MQHDRLDPAVGQVGAVRHRNGEVLVRAHHELGKIQPRLLLAGVRLDQRSEIGARVLEQPANAPVLQHAEVGLGDRGHPASTEFHWLAPLRPIRTLGIIARRKPAENPQSFALALDTTYLE